MSALRAYAGALALALLPGALWAQEGFDPGALDACLRTTPAEEWSECIGAGAEGCLAVPEGLTTVGSVRCVNAELDQWDAILNTAYRDLRSFLKAQDIEMDTTGAASSADALRQMQRAWIPYRDAMCTYERSQFYGGTIGQQVNISCYLQATAEQALRLLADHRALEAQ